MKINEEKKVLSIIENVNLKQLRRKVSASRGVVL